MYTETELYRIPSLDMGSFMVTAGDQFGSEVFYHRNGRSSVCRRTVNGSQKSIVEDSEMGRIFFYFYVVFSTNYYCASDRWHGNGFVWKSSRSSSDVTFTDSVSVTNTAALICEYFSEAGYTDIQIAAILVIYMGIRT